MANELSRRCTAWQSTAASRVSHHQFSQEKKAELSHLEIACLDYSKKVPNGDTNFHETQITYIYRHAGGHGHWPAHVPRGHRRNIWRHKWLIGSWAMHAGVRTGHARIWSRHWGVRPRHPGIGSRHNRVWCRHGKVGPRHGVVDRSVVGRVGSDVTVGWFGIEWRVVIVRLRIWTKTNNV